ncbi:MerR family transcriptional regulator [Roseimaritima ulvae]|uniref:B12-binding domain-containing protein n=1 Tax=Roseimaritima ulvae TaxID=980254 RepID=A0A5B9QSV0_9BACT|nr:B12-binding domain-containing protein [Roseimaritima ulvae]QEG40962.1 hypothetical protein UC8_29800 [Roseimaritima ulvae]
MRDLVTPKQLSRAIEVSESSVKRWCDQGVIAAQVTAGGHRRIAMAEVMEFVRGGKYELIHPEALGLPPISGPSARVIPRAREQMTAALIAGDEPRCRQIAIDLYLASHSLSVICDEVFAAAFEQIGRQWACGEAEIYQERRGCEMVLRILHELRTLLPAVAADAPLAIGGTVAGDPYSLGTTMVELVLRSVGWQAVSLGDNLPTATLAVAIEQQHPKLFWLSCSHIADNAEFLTGYRELYDRFAADVAFVVGGFALSESIRQEMKFAAYCDNMQHLEGFAQTLHAALVGKA